MNADVFGQRLRNARIMRGLSMDSLCIRMGNAVSKMAISKYENGQMFPDSTVLIKLSEALEMPVDYFFRPFSIGISSVRFRKKGRLPSKLEKSIRETVADRIDRYVNIEEICNETPVF